MDTSTPTSTTTAHPANVVVWDVPPAIVAGERFRIKVGIKCSQECPLANVGVGIFDDQGSPLASGASPGELWPGTTGLYVAEVELQAPAEEGFHEWSARGPLPQTARQPELDAEASHLEGSTSFRLRVVRQPEHLVTIEAVDQASQTALTGARVVMHPYRAVTDGCGVAKVRVPQGAYRLFVSETRYLTFGLPVDVTADMTVRAELDLEPVPERN